MLAHKASRLSLMIFALVALLGVVACRTTQPVSTQLSDSGITARVKAKLAADPQVNPFNIDVDTNEGVVTLTGRVERPEARAEAEKLAQDTDGVKDVVNLIKVGALSK